MRIGLSKFDICFDVYAAKGITSRLAFAIERRFVTVAAKHRNVCRATGYFRGIHWPPVNSQHTGTVHRNLIFALLLAWVFQCLLSAYRWPTRSHESVIYFELNLNVLRNKYISIYIYILPWEVKLDHTGHHSFMKLPKPQTKSSHSLKGLWY